VHTRTSTDALTSIARGVSIVAPPFAITLVLAGAVADEHGTPAPARTGAVVGLLFVLPLVVLTVWQTRRGAWSTVDASHPRERLVLLAVGTAGLLALLRYFARTRQETPFFTGTAGVLVMLALCAAVTPWLKVSLHMAAAALSATVLLWQGLPLGWVLAAVLPVLAWSRVALGRQPVE
jgi:TRAP-type C4-dicarboxylate transport system permease large subunit